MKKVARGLLVLFLVAACQSPAANAIPTPIIQHTATATAIPPTETPQPSPTPPDVELPQPSYEAPTLAPFPLRAAQLQPTALPLLGGLPPSSSLPLALSEHDHFYFSRPIAAADFGSLIPSQRYGVLQAAGELQDAHLGLDMGLNSGTPVRAAAPGTVIWASYGLLYNSTTYLDDPYGISVVIRHDFGFDGERLYTIYAHLSKAQVQIGQRVERGEVIALSGNTGLSTGPHLHFEVRLGGNTIYFTRNPELWIAPPEGLGVLAGRVTTSRDVLRMNQLVEITSLDSGQHWTTYTYATEYKLAADDYYEENFALSDLPAGRYEIAIPYLGVWRRVEVEIKPGAVTYFHFKGVDGFFFEPPFERRPENVPSS